MEKSSYFPSPLRKDYTSKPVRNFNPIIIKKASKPMSQAEPAPEQQRTIKYSDGLLVSIEKSEQGESGLFFMKDYSQDNKPHGENYVIYLSGVTVSVNYLRGIIHKWLVALLEGKFITVQHYRRGVREGLQYFYDVEEKLMVESLYERGKLLEIRSGVVGEFNKIIKNEEVIQKVEELKNRRLSLSPTFPSLQFGDFRYFGELGEKKECPHGYGILFGSKQMFMGQFSWGCLNGVGGIRFQNGDFYYGQFSNGITSGYGCLNSNNNILYKFDNQDIEKLEFETYLDKEFTPAVGQNWLAKYKDMKIMHEQYRRSYSIPAEEKRQQECFQNLQGSELNLEIEDTISKRQELEFDEYNDKVMPAIKKSQMIPKLSLFQQMKIKEKSKHSPEDRSARANEDFRQHDTDRHRIRTQRNERDDRVSSNKSRIEVGLKKSARAQELKQKESQSRISKEDRSLVQQVGTDKWYVAPEHQFMKPNQLQPKAKIDRSQRTNLQKNDSNVHLNMGKLMRVGSDVSEERQENFFSRMLADQQ